MAIDIASLADMISIPGVAYAQVTTEDQVTQFAQTATSGYGFGDEGLPIFQQIAAGGCLPPSPEAPYHLAYLDGRPVATCVTCLYSGVAGLYIISTIPEARGRGIGGQITRYALLNARSLGYRVGVLQASAMGFPVYRRLGFEQYATYHEYSWPPTAGGHA